MIHTIEEFLSAWKHESEETLKLFWHLTDDSLKQPSYPGGRTLGRLANHIIETITELPSKLDLGIHEENPAHVHAKDITDHYQRASDALVNAISSKWTDANLHDTHNLYGQNWTNSFSLWVLVTHQIHHRGQMTILMRQAGLKVPGLYGPAKEEWVAMGMKPLE